MKVICSNCGKLTEVQGIGRKRLAIPVNIVLDAVSSCDSTKAAAVQLHCSTGYIYQVLKANGLKLKDVLKR